MNWIVVAAASSPLLIGDYPLRLVVPSIECVDASVFGHLPLLDWMSGHEVLLNRERWPTIDELDALRIDAMRSDGIGRPQISTQSPHLLKDGLHYEERILRGRLATREKNWHDLLNALVWLRYPRIKQALNLAQCRDISRVGRRERTRAQCAMTHFDEAGAVVLCSDPSLITLWNQHDWRALFWRERDAWDRRIAVQVFGHAILELALQPQRLLVAKCIVLLCDEETVSRLRTDATSIRAEIDARIAQRIAGGAELGDPQDLPSAARCLAFPVGERTRSKNGFSSTRHAFARFERDVAIRHRVDFDQHKRAVAGTFCFAVRYIAGRLKSQTS